jgi:hypothetical protein
VAAAAALSYLDFLLLRIVLQLVFRLLSAADQYRNSSRRRSGVQKLITRLRLQTFDDDDHIAVESLFAFVSVRRGWPPGIVARVV